MHLTQKKINTKSLKKKTPTIIKLHNHQLHVWLVSDQSIHRVWHDQDHWTSRGVWILRGHLILKGPWTPGYYFLWCLEEGVSFPHSDDAPSPSALPPGWQLCPDYLWTVWREKEKEGQVTWLIIILFSPTS